MYGNKTNQTGTSRGLVTPSTAASNYLLLDAVWVDSFNGDGFAFESSGGTLSATIVHCESRVNAGYGMKFYGTSTDTMVTSCYIDQNVLSGVHCASGDLSLTSCHIWGNGTGASGDRDGITFQSAAACRIINCYIEGNHNGSGVRFKTGTMRGHIIANCDIWDNGNQGIYAFGASNCVFSGNVIRTNNWVGGSGVNGAGLVVDSCTSMVISGNQFFSVGAGRQTYGFYENGSSNVDIRFVDNVSRAADHTTGGVFLGPGTRADLGSVARYKTADQSVTASTTLVDDVDLTFPAVVGEVWEIDGLLFVDGATTGDITVRVAAPSGMSGYWRALGCAASNTSASAASMVPGGVVFNGNATIGALGAGVISTVKIEGLLIVGTAGNVVVRWAQGTSDPTATIVKAGSYLRARRVAQ
jgi:parallel beta-helix repeat protein